MRSSRSGASRSGADPLNPGPAGFAHRGLHRPGVPENSVAAFRAAIETGAGIECDVRLSSDGEVMVFHDHDLQRMCASALTVEATPASRLADQRLLGTKEHIPRLADLLDLVGGRVSVLIELKIRGRNAAKLAAAVAAGLAHYEGPVGVMSFDPAVGKWLVRKAPRIRRGLVISRRASAFDRWRCIWAAAPHFLAVDRAALPCAWVSSAREKRWLYSWTIRSPAERKQATVQADALIWEADGRP